MHGPVTEQSASLVTAQLLWAEAEAPDKVFCHSGPRSPLITPPLTLDSLDRQPIFMYINSPGGLVSAGLAIYDTMQ